MKSNCLVRWVNVLIDEDHGGGFICGEAHWLPRIQWWWWGIICSWWTLIKWNVSVGFRLTNGSWWWQKGRSEVDQAECLCWILVKCDISEMGLAVRTECLCWILVINEMIMFKCVINMAVMATVCLHADRWPFFLQLCGVIHCEAQWWWQGRPGAGCWQPWGYNSCCLASRAWWHRS